ncbi:hypothetical protein [Sphaerimonospora mesophila]|uniref:hypothetical protein n=1 Tax=Sphaerimonospora mesophila TaxID=37483 RepID=UPI0006E1A722
MADYDFPSDLIEAQRAFLAADARCEELAQQGPPATAIVEGTAAMPENLRQELEAARAERLRLISVLYGHPFWGEIPQSDWFAARMALREAAQS